MKTFKDIVESSKDDMFAWVLDRMENSEDDSEEMKADFQKKFGKSDTKKHWDDLVTSAMEG